MTGAVQLDRPRHPAQRGRVPARAACCCARTASSASRGSRTPARWRPPTSASGWSSPPSAAIADAWDGYGLAEGACGIGPAFAVVSGNDTRRGGEPYVNQNFLGSQGGPAGPEHDGWITYGNAVTNGLMFRDSVEIDEQKYPIRVRQIRMRMDSEGAGRRRGAPGAVVEFGPKDADDERGVRDRRLPQPAARDARRRRRRAVGPVPRPRPTAAREPLPHDRLGAARPRRAARPRAQRRAAATAIRSSASRSGCAPTCSRSSSPSSAPATSTAWCSTGDGARRLAGGRRGRDGAPARGAARRAMSPGDRIPAARNAGIATFMGLPSSRELDGIASAVVGIPYDLGGEAGGRHAPRAIRNVSWTLRPAHGSFHIDVTRDGPAVDYGDVACTRPIARRPTPPSRRRSGRSWTAAPSRSCSRASTRCCSRS